MKIAVSFTNLLYCPCISTGKKRQAQLLLTKMPRKCYVSVCNGNYETEKEYVKVHSFSSDPAEQQS